MTKEFDKSRLAKNINYLLKEKSMKIGDFEKSVGVSAGYLSRITKDESSNPSLDFVVNSANHLGVSIDELLSTDLSELSETDVYFKKFLDKLTSETKKGNIEWQGETPEYLNTLQFNFAGYTVHPLFKAVKIEESDDSGEVKEFTPQYGVFMSKAYGVHTRIDDFCYHFDIDNNNKLYVMHIDRDDSPCIELGLGIVEIWLVDSSEESSFMGGESSFPKLKNSLLELYVAINSYRQNPHLPWSIKHVIDGYMSRHKPVEELTDDDIPF